MTGIARPNSVGLPRKIVACLDDGPQSSTRQHVRTVHVNYFEHIICSICTCMYVCMCKHIPMYLVFVIAYLMSTCGITQYDYFSMQDGQSRSDECALVSEVLLPPSLHMQF